MAASKRLKESNRASLREYITSTLSNMQTDMRSVEAVISEFEQRIRSIMEKIDNLEQRVAYLENLLGVTREEQRSE